MHVECLVLCPGPTWSRSGSKHKLVPFVSLKRRRSMEKWLSLKGDVTTGDVNLVIPHACHLYLNKY